MTSEIAEIVRFLERTPPFQFLEKAQLASLSPHIEVRYAKAGSGIIEAGQHNEWLFVVRSGSVELRLAGEELTARLGTGSTFAYPSLLRGGEVRNSTYAIEDTLLYALSADEFHTLREASPAFREFFAEDESSRIRHALAKRRENSSFALTSQPVGELVARATPVSCSGGATIREAVAIMHNSNVSTLAICDDGQLRGIFTDKDLRSRVVAAGLSLDAPISHAMTAGPRTLTTNATVAEAMALMASVCFRHIPADKRRAEYPQSHRSNANLSSPESDGIGEGELSIAVRLSSVTSKRSSTEPDRTTNSIHVLASFDYDASRFCERTSI
jgi:CBS domain-containing protein